MKKRESSYDCWLSYDYCGDESLLREYRYWAGGIEMRDHSELLATAESELSLGLTAILGQEGNPSAEGYVVLGALDRSKELLQKVGEETSAALQPEGYVIRTVRDGHRPYILLAGKTEQGALYAVFHFLRLLQTGQDVNGLDILENPKNALRMINHWDNMDGSIERGYAGKSFFYRDKEIMPDPGRIRDYARLLASAGINAISINNVNVHETETRLITNDYLPVVAAVADIFRKYGIKTFLSINFASPIQIGGLATADPLDEGVLQWWKERADDIYRLIPDFGGFLVKADSEFRPGPFTYGRDHADGANMLAKALKPHGGLVIWRSFVYNCLQDWRDRTTDRARAAYDHFTPLDGRFEDNVILQIKNGPMDFQVREPVSPLFGGLTKTNQMLELQITQEYTGQQKHLFYLVPQWKEVVDFDTYSKGEGTSVAEIASGHAYNRPYGGFAAVSNVGDNENWTGHTLAQANLYGFGRLAWNPALSSEEIAREWAMMTFGTDAEVVDTISDMLLRSPDIYENYTAPLGVGWMVNPNHHYGPNVDGYEYSKWGTYHFADCNGIGVDRTVHTGTGYAGQYHSPQSDRYESVEHCPDELLLFFHHVSYQHRLKSGRTVIQHIYDTHFEGVEQAGSLVERCVKLKGKIDEARYAGVLRRLQEQAEHAKEWRDIINTYFYRKSGIPDEQHRTIY